VSGHPAERRIGPRPFDPYTPVAAAPLQSPRPVCALGSALLPTILNTPTPPPSSNTPTPPKADVWSPAFTTQLPEATGVSAARLHSLVGAAYLPYLGSMALEPDTLEVGRLGSCAWLGEGRTSRGSDCWG